MKAMKLAKDLDETIIYNIHCFIVPENIAENYLHAIAIIALVKDLLIPFVFLQAAGYYFIQEFQSMRLFVFNTGFSTNWLPVLKNKQ
jgi:hypothetical protein